MWFFFFSSRRRHTRWTGDWSSDVCSSDLIGILGATVMPHNLYLHSSVVQTRSYEETPAGKREAVKFAFLDSTVALSFALFINAAILIVAAATFHRAGQTGVAEIQDAYRLLTP